MPTQIERDATVVLRALAEAPRFGHVDAQEVAEATGLPPERLNDAVTILVESGYADWLRTLGTAPYEFRTVQITARGRYEYQRLQTEAQPQPPETTEGKTMPTPTLPPVPVGSPYGFKDEDWEIVAERKSRADRLYVVLGFQFSSTHYDADKLKANLEDSFKQAVTTYAAEAKQAIDLEFRPLAAGYGEHLFNEIARDIISADIAVFEMSDHNPNVTLEMGVALTWGVRVLPIKAEGRPHPPSDISGQTWADYRDSATQFVDPNHHSKLVRMIERAIRKKGRGAV